jgi:hypothetical protein
MHGTVYTRVTARTLRVESLIGLKYGHSHSYFTGGEIIKMVMMEKGKLRARIQSESIDKLVYFI